MRSFPLAALAAALTVSACAPATPRATTPAATPLKLAPAQAAASAPLAPDPSLDTRGAPGAPLAWAPFDATAFARAKAEHKLVLLDGAAEWCHWCHVMEATTYHDPAVRRLLDAHFVAAKVDVDSRPDVEERYSAYGWPATVLFSADGAELGKYRGYIAPEAFAEILAQVTEAPAPRAAGEPPQGTQAALGSGPMTEDEIAWIAHMTELELADFYDDENGGWGRWQKAAVAVDDEWEMSRARAGDAEARERALFTLDKERALVDPVWGGLYQYSAASDWAHPHFEKLMTFQAGALESYSEAYALTHDPKWLAVAKAMRRYIDEFLTSPEGGFYATEDADLNAHEPGKRFLTGHEYYPLDDAHRRALGIPRVDTHEYGKENGLAIAAYVSFYEATGDATALAAAEKAAKRVLATHATRRGGITHEPHEAGQKENDVLHLADNAAFGLGLMRLADAKARAAAAGTADGGSEYREAAAAIADFLQKELGDGAGGGFYGSSVDPDAVGVFAVRRKPFEENVTAIRMLARLAKGPNAAKDAKTGATYARTIGLALRAIATPDAIKGRGRILGDLLLALDETRGVR